MENSKDHNSKKGNTFSDTFSTEAFLDANLVKLSEFGNGNKEYDEHGNYSGRNIYSMKDLDSPVTYSLNPNGFRCDNFEQVDGSKLTILTSGCSFTFGQGVFEEQSWPRVLSKMIQESSSKEVKLYNLGSMGGSIRLTIKNAMAFIRKFGKPDYIYLLFPHPSRDIYWDDGAKRFTHLTINKEWLSFFTKSSKDKSVRKFYESYSEEASNLLAIDLISLFEDFCNASGIKLVWASWSYDEKYYAAAKFKNQEKLNHKDYDLSHFGEDGSESFAENSEGIPFWDMADDGVHPGARWHKEFARMLFDKIGLTND
jgi:lysophospholipase L1-like esterase